ncbi:MAG: hypothetical protein QM683_15875 [Lacrimispora sp.]
MKKEFVEALLMSKQDCEMLVNIFSCQKGECFKSCQIIEKAVIIKQEFGIGLEIRDRACQNAIVKIGYPRLKNIKIMELEDMILTFIYETIRIEVMIRGGDAKY